MMRAINLHGRLGEEFGPLFNFDVETAGEAIRALQTNFPTFLDALKEGSFELIRGDEEDGMRLELEDVNEFRLGQGDLHIVPVIEGAKHAGGIVKAILGVALIGAAVFLGPAGGVVAGIGAGTLSAGVAGSMAMFGLSMTLMGVSSALTPHRSADNTNGNSQREQSYEIAGPTNLYEQGNPVPIIIGEGIFGSVLISVGEDIDPVPVGWDPITGLYLPALTGGH